MKLILVRGIPGSGKSTFAELLNTKAICTADDYYMHGGEYRWIPEDIGKAHEWCQRKCRRFMKKRIDRIVVANTSTTQRELKPYYDLARQHGYTVYCVIVENRHEGVNIHEVPEAVLDKMRNRFDVKL
jgi:predicted kinase